MLLGVAFSASIKESRTTGGSKCRPGEKHLGVFQRCNSLSKGLPWLLYLEYPLLGVTPQDYLSTLVGGTLDLFLKLLNLNPDLYHSDKSWKPGTVPDGSVLVECEQGPHSGWWWTRVRQSPCQKSLGGPHIVYVGSFRTDKNKETTK